MNVGDRVKIVMYSDWHMKAAISSWCEREGVITSLSNQPGFFGGVPCWYVRLDDGTSLWAPEKCLLVLHEAGNQNRKEKSMLLAITVLGTPRDNNGEEQIVVPTTEVSATDQNLALVRYGAQNPEKVEAAAKSNKLRVLVRSLG